MTAPEELDRLAKVARTAYEAQQWHDDGWRAAVAAVIEARGAAGGEVDQLKLALDIKQVAVEEANERADRYESALQKILEEHCGLAYEIATNALNAEDYDVEQEA